MDHAWLHSTWALPSHERLDNVHSRYETVLVENATLPTNCLNDMFCFVYVQVVSRCVFFYLFLCMYEVHRECVFMNNGTLCHVDFLS